MQEILVLWSWLAVVCPIFFLVVLLFVAQEPATISVRWLIMPVFFTLVGFGILIFSDPLSLWFKLPTIFGVSMMSASILSIVGVNLLLLLGKWLLVKLNTNHL